MRTLLALFAHPDDESFSAGGTLAHYARQGAQLVLACATRGEAGILHDSANSYPEDMGRTREEELRCAARVLGIHELRFLGYRDSGMEPEHPAHSHPRSFVRADPQRVVGQILDLLHEFQPQVVLTYGPEGGSGHPDHLAIHRHATAAWQAVDKAGEDAFPHPPRKLYYVARSRRRYRQFRRELWRRGLYIGPPTEEEIARRSVPDEHITTWIDVWDYQQIRLQALRCHRTQVSPGHPYLNLPPELLLEYFASETFTLAAARGLPIAPGETDLFAGLGPS